MSGLDDLLRVSYTTLYSPTLTPVPNRANRSPRFDYIVAHGVHSWIDARSRDDVRFIDRARRLSKTVFDLQRPAEMVHVPSMLTMFATWAELLDR